MEASPGRNGSLPLSSSQPQRKEWRAVPEHSFRSNGGEETEHAKLGQSDVRTIYEEDVDFCSITIDGSGLSGDAAPQQRIHDISRQRMELQEMEIQLRAQVIARAEILEMRNRYEAQIKENAATTANLKEQLQEREQFMHDLEMKIEEKERELRAVKIDNEVAWAKEDLLMEQNKELAVFRRERDNSEAERSQLLKQIHDLQGHLQEKDSQFLELEEQQRIAQETILYKDEQIREAQAWISRVQMDALQTTANQSLQAELRDRTEQFNQYWAYLHRQYADMERHLLQVIQQLQLELAAVRGQSGLQSYGSQGAHGDSKDSSAHVQSNENQSNDSDNGALSEKSVFMSNGSLESVQSLASASNALTKNEYIPGVPVVPPSMIGMSAFVPPAQMNTSHPFILHPQGNLHSVPSMNPHLPQSQPSQLQPNSTIPSNKEWPSQQAEPDTSPISTQYQPSQTKQNLWQSNPQFNYEFSSNKGVTNSDYAESSICHMPISSSVMTGSSPEVQMPASNGEQSQVSQESLEKSNDNTQYHSSLAMNTGEQTSEAKVDDDTSVVATTELQGQDLISGKPRSPTNHRVSDISTHSASTRDPSKCNVGRLIMSDVSGSTSRASIPLKSGKTLEPALLDEKSLLACIVRAVPAGSSGQIRISTTLPNRLGKMLAPLNWQDYKQQYGELDSFVAHHPELFVVEGDFIHLREGAQEIVSANAAAAKFAAVTAGSMPCLPQSIVVTPVAQGHRLKRCLPTDGEPLNTGSAMLVNSANSCNQQPNGFYFEIVQGLSDVKVVSKAEDPQYVNGLSSKMQPTYSTTHKAAINGPVIDKIGVSSSQTNGLSNGRHGLGRQQARTAGIGLIARK